MRLVLGALVFSGTLVEGQLSPLSSHVNKLSREFRCVYGYTTEGCREFQSTANRLRIIRWRVPQRWKLLKSRNGYETLFDKSGMKVTFFLTKRFVMSNGLLLFYAKKWPSQEAAETLAPYVIKYLVSCGREDPLVDEYVFSRVVERLKGNREASITPEMFAISLPYTPTTFTFDDEVPEELAPDFLVEKLECSSYLRARFIVEQRIGLSVAHLMPRYFLPTSDASEPKTAFDNLQKRIIATQIFKAGIQLLQEIHQLGIIHGDVNPGNLALREYSREPDTILSELLKADSKSFTNPRSFFVLIDFGKARFIPEIKTERKEETKGMNLSLLSPWHLLGGPIGPRDDVFRLFELYLNLLSENRLAVYYTGYPERAPLAEIKTNENLIVRAKISSEYAQYLGRQDLAHLGLIEKLMNLVRGDDGTKAPKYEEILETTNTILSGIGAHAQNPAP